MKSILLFGCALVFLPWSFAHGASIVWTNVSGGSWGTAANWSPNQVPGSADNAFITNSGTYAVIVNVNATVASLQAGGSSGSRTLSLSSSMLTLNGASLLDTNCTFTLSGGTLSGSGEVMVRDALTWTGGAMSGSGKTIIANGGTLSLNDSTHFLNRVLQSDGTATWTAGDLLMTGGTFNNNGSCTANSGSTLQSYGNGGVNAFNNAGTFTKQGTGLTRFFVNSTGVSFNNSGAVDAQEGTLGLDAGGTHGNDFAVGSGATLRLNGAQTFGVGSDITGAGGLSVAGGTITDAGTVNVGGTTIFSGGTATFSSSFTGGSFLMVSGGTVNFNGTAVFAPGATLTVSGGTANLGASALTFGSGTLSGGTLSGSGEVMVRDALTWTGGAMSGSGKTIIANGGTLSLNDSTHFLNRVLQSDGTATWTAGDLLMTGGTFNNNGSCTANSGSTLQSYGNGGVNAFNNAGTFTKQGTGLTRFFVNSTGVSFNNSGAVDAQEGTLTLNAGFTQTGGQTILSGGTVSANSTMRIQGGVLGGVGLISASVNSSGTVSPGASPGRLTISGNFTQSANGALNVELAGTVVGASFDQLAIGGTAALAGMLNVTLTNNFEPATNASFTFLTCGSRSGSFSAFVYPSNNVGMQLTYSGTSATIQVTNVQFTSTVYWVGGTGDWNTESNWSTGTLPGPTDDVLINVAGAVIVTHSSGTHRLRSLVSQNALVLSGGSLTLSSTIQVNNALTLAGGTLHSTTVLPGTGGQGLVATTAGGTLDGVMVNGDLDLTANGANATVLNGLVLNGTARLGSQANANAYGYLSFAGSQTLSGTGTVVFGQSSCNLLRAQNSGTTLTVGPSMTVRGQSGRVGSEAGQCVGGPRNVGVVNQGTISADVGGGTIYIGAETFTNQGLVDASNGTISLSGAYSLVGGTLRLGITSLTGMALR